MHWFDTLALAIIIYMVVMGAWRGFLREIFPAMSILAGGLSAAVAQQNVSSMLSGFVDEGLGRDITAYILVFMLAWAAVALVGYGIRRLTDRFESATTLNRAAGFGLGVAKGALVLAIIAVALGVAPAMRKDVDKKSVSGHTFIVLGNFTLEQLSPGLAARLGDTTDDGIMEKVKLLRDTAAALDPTKAGAKSGKSDSK
ncbi:MAG: CvpA family protein [Nitrospinota bacterium]|nr:CvpA family protein [Nitrospinota bacterium]